MSADLNEFRAQRPDVWAAMVRTCGGDVRLAEQLSEQVIVDARTEGEAEGVARERARCVQLATMAVAMTDDASWDRLLEQVNTEVAPDEALVAHMLADPVRAPRAHFALQAKRCTTREQC